MKQKPTAAMLQEYCDDWNRKYPIGTEVLYQPVMGQPECTFHKTRSAAYVLSGHTAAIFLDGVSGCVSLRACSIPVF